MRISYEIRDRLMRKSSNTLGLCFQCGSCTATCPLSVTSSAYIRKIIKYAQYGVIPEDEKIIEILWRCTTCGMCVSSCPRGVDIPSIIRGFREILSERRIQDHRITETLWRLYEAGNPWGYGSGEIKKFRLSMKDLFEEKTSQKPDYIIYSCCSTVIDPVSQKMARSIATLLKRLGFNIKILDPMCCGDVIYEAGEIAFLEEYAQKIFDIINRLDSTLITVSPHTHYMLKRVYPELGVKTNVEIIHYTQILKELIDKNKIKLRSSDRETVVTYHDPCYLARYLNIVEEPRSVIENIPGVKFVEMEHSRENTLCCGAGGGRIFSEETGVRLARYRLKEADDTGANMMTTACQFCVRMFVDEMKIFSSKYINNITDLSELILSRLE